MTYKLTAADRRALAEWVQFLNPGAKLTAADRRALAERVQFLKPGAKLTAADRLALAWVQFCRDRKAAQKNPPAPNQPTSGPAAAANKSKESM